MAEKIYYLSDKDRNITSYFKSKKQIKSGTETLRGEVVTASRAKKYALVLGIDIAQVPEIPESEAIPPKERGKGLEWYGETVATRIPKAWLKDVQRCMLLGITPDFDPKLNKPEIKESKPRANKPKYSAELIKEALALYDQGLSAAKVWDDLDSRGFSPMPSKTNMSRTLKKWKES